MKPIPLLVAYLLALTVSPASAAEVVARKIGTFHVDDPGKWTQPVSIVAPVYPEALLAKGISGVVDVRVKISPYGGMKAILAISSEPPVPEFEAAVRDAIQYWSFSEPLDAECRPQPSEGNNRIWFEIVDGKGSISISRVPQRMPPGHHAVRMRNSKEVEDALAARFPREARKSGAQGIVYARLEVDAATGLTRSVDTSHIFADKSSARDFGRAARDGLAGARFTLPPEVKDDIFHVCKRVTYTLR